MDKQNKIIYNIKEQGKIKVKNDIIKSSFTVKSKLYASSSESYNSVLIPVERIKELLIKKSNIRNVLTNFNINPEWDYVDKKGKVLLGYNTIVRISYEQKIKNDQEVKEAADVQNNIVNLSGNNSTITLDSLRYSVSDKNKKKFEDYALRNAIENGKRKASLLVASTYPDRRYKIIRIDVNDNDSGYNDDFVNERAHSLRSAAMDTPNNIISQGTSTISASIYMKIQVV